jgi:hypothetical protein
VRKLDSRFVKQKVEYILGQVKINAPPVNLVAIARLQHVRTIELRPMLIRGCIEPVEGGFNLYIRDRSTRSLSLDDVADLDSLKPRQRFVLAHEIAHTFFYDFALDPPRISKQAPKSEIMEWLCQQGASQLLLPDRFLLQYLSKDKPLDINLAVEIGKKFKASTEAVIRRVDELDSAKAPFRALVLVRLNRDRRDAKIRAVCFHHSLLPFLPRPKLYSHLTEWLSIFQREEEFWTEKMWDYENERKEGKLFIKKRSQRTREDAFFLEVLFEQELDESKTTELLLRHRLKLSQ